MDSITTPLQYVFGLMFGLSAFFLIQVLIAKEKTNYWSR